jgi:hypothetical protein
LFAWTAGALPVSLHQSLDKQLRAIAKHGQASTRLFRGTQRFELLSAPASPGFFLSYAARGDCYGQRRGSPKVKDTPQGRYPIPTLAGVQDIFPAPHVINNRPNYRAV